MVPRADVSSMRSGQAELTAPARRSSRQVEPPTTVEWLRRLADVSGPEQALQVWSEAALATGRLGMELGPDDLERVGQWLVQHCADQPMRMAVRSCLVRLHVHRAMNRVTPPA